MQLTTMITVISSFLCSINFHPFQNQSGKIPRYCAPFPVNTLPVLIAPQERVCTSDFISREDEQSQMKAELENRLTLPSRGDARSTLSETSVMWKTNGGMCKTLKNCCASYAWDPAINLSSTISVGRRQEACEREMLRGEVAQRNFPLLFPFSRRRW